MNKIKSEFKPADEIRSVSIKEQQVFNTGKTVYTVHVTRNTVTIDNIIDAICQKRPECRHYVLKQFAADLQEEILANLASGNAVDLLDLGCLYLAAGALKNRPADVNDIGELTVKFTASSMTNEAVKDIAIDKMVVADSSPVISTVECLGAKAEGTLEVGKVARLSGAQLKLGSEGSFVAFAPMDESGAVVLDESKWLKVDDSLVIRNLPKTLEFYVPSTVPSDADYCVVLRTNCGAGSVERKRFDYSISRTVHVQ